MPTLLDEVDAAGRFIKPYLDKGYGKNVLKYP